MAEHDAQQTTIGDMAVFRDSQTERKLKVTQYSMF